MITIHESKDTASEKIRVTFSMPAEQECRDALYLVGWFGEWDEAVYRMERASGDMWTLTLELEPGCQYLYRYRTLNGQWLNDPAVPATGGQQEAKNSFYLTSQGKTAPSELTH
jgi:hypothetical protein